MEVKNNAEQIIRLKKLRELTGLNRTEFSQIHGIPLRTMEDWEAGRRKMPDYLLRLLTYKIKIDLNIRENKNIDIIQDECGRSIVIINDIRFKSRRNINWLQIEEYLKEYIGKCYEIIESSEKVYIGSDFPDEFSHSKDTKNLKGANEKAKANIVPAINQMIQIATNKTEFQDYGQKHKAKAKYGWYRYDTRFGIPVYSENGELIRYNIFKARMLVRHDSDGKLYLYDFVRTKKETSRPLE